MHNWNTLLRYIKLKLGVPTNEIELNDDDIISYIKENTLPELSTYLDNRKLIVLRDEHRELNKDGYPCVYYLPLNIEYIDVYKLYLGTNAFLPTGSIGYFMIDPKDTVMYNELIDMINSLSTITTYKFELPNIIRLDRVIDPPIIADVRYVPDISEIPADFYHNIFKRRALADIMLLISAQRKKYRLSTPFGEIDLNWEELQSTAKEIIAEIDSMLDAMPPEYLIEWID